MTPAPPYSRPHIPVSASHGAPTTVVLDAPYTERLRIAASATHSSFFRRATIDVPGSHLTSFGSDFGTGRAASGVLRGPIEAITLGVTFNCNAHNSPGSWSGVRDNTEGAAVVADQFMTDLTKAVSAAVARYNDVVATVAEEAELGDYVAVRKMDELVDCKGLRTRQLAMAMMDLPLVNDAQEMRKHCLDHGCKLSLVAIHTPDCGLSQPLYSPGGVEDDDPSPPERSSSRHSGRTSGSRRRRESVTSGSSRRTGQ